MGTALVYILSSATLAIILALTRSKGHAVIDGEDVFRYRPKLLKVLYGCAFAPVACVIFIDVVSQPRPGVTAMALTMCVALFASSLVLWVWKGLKAFEVHVQSDGLAIKKAKKESFLPFSQVSKIIYLKSSGDGGTLELYGWDRSPLVEFTETMEDIDQLATLVVARAREHHVDCLVTETRPLRAF